IIEGLKNIHQQNLVHRDFHAGNILTNHAYNRSYISDLGLCRPANEVDDEKTYGVLPYIAPEVLRDQPYTQKSDIYSFGIVTYEIFASSYPYYELSHDEFLAIKICQGLRPNIDELKIPQLLKDLIKKC
ncbi:kinase-like domain-containing protein, partial [Glomus cerebriforme]